MKMVEWIKKLDDLMTLSVRLLLVGKGTISHEEAKKKAIAEFEKYRRMEMLQYESDSFLPNGVIYFLQVYCEIRFYRDTNYSVRSLLRIKFCLPFHIRICSWPLP